MIFVDSNILIDVLTPDQAWYAWSRERIAATASTDRLVINTIVVAELSSNFADLASLHRALALWEVGIEALDDEVAFGAGQAFRAYRRRYRERDAMLSDFLIGAHAIRLGAALLTRDAAIYRAYFPDLPLITPETNPHG